MQNQDIIAAQNDLSYAGDGIIHIPSLEYNHMIESVEDPNNNFYNNLYIDVNDVIIPDIFETLNNINPVTYTIDNNNPLLIDVNAECPNLENKKRYSNKIVQRVNLTDYKNVTLEELTNKELYIPLATPTTTYTISDLMSNQNKLGIDKTSTLKVMVTQPDVRPVTVDTATSIDIEPADYNCDYFSSVTVNVFPSKINIKYFSLSYGNNMVRDEIKNLLTMTSSGTVAVSNNCSLLKIEFYVDDYSASMYVNNSGSTQNKSVSANSRYYIGNNIANPVTFYDENNNLILKFSDNGIDNNAESVSLSRAFFNLILS